MQVTRWRRYGKDRLYVKDADGHDLGWRDLAANTAHPTTNETDQALRETVTAWQASAASLGTEPDPSVNTQEPTPIPEPTPDPVRGPGFLPPESAPTVSQLVWPGPVEEEVVAPTFVAAAAGAPRPPTWPTTIRVSNWLTRSRRPGRQANDPRCGDASGWARTPTRPGSVGPSGNGWSPSSCPGWPRPIPAGASSTRSPSATRSTSTYSPWDRAECSRSTPSTTAEAGSGWAATRSWSTAPASPTCATAGTRRARRPGC